MIDRFRTGSGGLRVTLAWSARVRGAAAEGSGGGVVRHGVPYAGPAEDCACVRHECGGLVPVSWCADHGIATAPVMECHPGGGLRCTALAARRA
ncbi:hypothetical protein ABT403_13725 [Streptomyces sp. NPDC000075]|uniref:hypothetical protein n=1 Tax=Streptomyces TaxID=1883 RepID=UPI0031DC4D9A